MTSEQIAYKFFNGNRMPANRRLRILYDLYCVNRFFPPVPSGMAPQHVVLDRAGLKIIGSDSKPIASLPRHYNHTILVNDWLIRWHGETNYKLGKIIPDIYYPEYKLAVEIDTGTESRNTLKNKLLAYNQLNIRLCVVASKPRLEYVSQILTIPNVLVEADKIEKAIEILKKRP